MLLTPVLLPCPADTLHANLAEVRDLFEIKRFAMFDQVCGGCGECLWQPVGQPQGHICRPCTQTCTCFLPCSLLPAPQFPYTHHVECGVYLQRRKQQQDEQAAAAADKQQADVAPATNGAAATADEGGRGAKRKAEEGAA